MACAEINATAFHDCLRRGSAIAAACAAGVFLSCQAVRAANPIDTGKSYYLASGLGSSVDPDFKGGTLRLDSTATISKDFTVEDYSANTIDSYGNAVTMSGIFSGAGPLTFTDSVGGGNVIFTNSGNSYTGSTTINSGAMLTLSGAGSIVDSSGLVDNGTFSIAPTTSGASIVSLSGAGTVTLGTQSLTVTDGAGTFSGTISGSGGLVLSGGTEALTGANTYTGGTTILGGTLQIGGAGTTGTILGNVADAGTLAFYHTDNLEFDGTISGTGGVTQSGSGILTLTAVNTYTGGTTISAGTLALSSSSSIAGSSVSDTGTFDISATAGTSIKSLAGTGTVQLGTQTLTLTAASGTFSGVLAGGGNLVLNGGTELLSGANTYTGSTTVNGGTLALGSTTVTNNITDNAAVAFYTTGTVAMSGVISGTGSVTQSSGSTTISAAQTYTGLTTISAGTLALSGSGAIANSSGVVANGAFSIAAATSGVSIASLSGTGTVQLGALNLTLANASGTFSGVISGSGSLTLAGGSETLSGANTFTGVTTISGGTLVLSNTQSLAASDVVDNATLDISQVTGASGATTTLIVSLAGTGTVALGAKTLILAAASDTFSGTISGSGGLTLNGGVETLTGASNYTGTTTISGGTLILSGAGSLSASSAVSVAGYFDISDVTVSPTVTLASLAGSSSGTVDLGAENLNLANASGTFFGTISGTGQLMLSGGTEILAGANSYSGGTVITAGTLQIGNGYTSGSIVGNVADAGVLTFDRSDTSTVSGTISGTGAVIQLGSGTTILTAANTYSGGTTITAGTLQIGNDAASGSIVGDVQDRGTLAFARSDTTTFSGLISGTGGVTQVSGTTILTANESYTGSTVIDTLAGLQLVGSASIASSSGVTDNGSLDLSATSAPPQLASLSGSGTLALGGQTLTLTKGAGAFSGTISGTGGLVLTGGSGETLSGTNTYSGSTIVNGGSLSINGSIAASSGVTVNSGGTLAGSGTVPAVVLASGATISPGSAGSGTLKVNGSVAFSSGDNFVVAVNGTSAGKLSASGAEALAGTLSVVTATGSYPLGQKLTVLTAAGGVTGTFTVSPVVSTGAQFSSKVSYDANDVYLEVDLAKLTPLLPSGATVNEHNVVAGIDAAITAGDALPVQFQNLGTVSSATLQNDAGQMSSEIAGDVAHSGNSLFNPFVTAIFDHVADQQPTGSARSRMPQQDQIWASGVIGSDLVTGDEASTGTHKLSSNLTGIVAGGDWNYSPTILLGVAASVGAVNFHLADNVGQGKLSAFQFGFYGLAQYSRHFYGSFVGAVSLDNGSTSRSIAVSGTDTLTGKFSGLMFGGRYETGAALGWISPYVSLQDNLFDAHSYKETATSGSNTYALSYAAHMTNYANFEVGIRQRGDFNMGGWIMSLSDQLAWQHDMSATPSAQAAFTALPDSTFAVYGSRNGKNAMLLSFGASVATRDGFGLDLHLDGVLAPRAQTYTGFAGLKFAW